MVTTRDLALLDNDLLENILASIQADLATFVQGDLSTKVNAGPSGHQILNLWAGTQAQYDAISPKVATTLYVVTN